MIQRSWAWAASVLAVSALASLALPAPTLAQMGAAAKRAAASAAVRTAEKRAAQAAASRATQSAVVRSAARGAPDLVRRRWSTALCKASAPCPLPEHVGSSFRGSSYNETVLGRNTILYRNYTDPKLRLGNPADRHSYWSRSDARGTQAIIDHAIPVSRNGNVAARQVSVTFPKGTRVFEGRSSPFPGGPVGGGNQIVISRD